MASPVKYYLDEHLHPAVAAGLRRRGIDVLTAQEASMISVSDSDHLALAIRTQRVLVTQDRDFLRLHGGGINHGGIVYAPQGTTIGDFVRRLILIHELLTSEEMQGHVEYV